MQMSRYSYTHTHTHSKKPNKKQARKYVKNYCYIDRVMDEWIKLSEKLNAHNIGKLKRHHDSKQSSRDGGLTNVELLPHSVKRGKYKMVVTHTHTQNLP